MSWDENVSPYSAVTLYHADLTAKNIGRVLAIVLDGKILLTF